MSGKLYRLQRTLALPIARHACWEFFSDPQNLAAITPPSLRFEMIDSHVDSIFPGQVLAYRVAPLFGIGMQWITEITHVVAPELFVDEQRFGPYRFWHHAHRFCPIDGGTQIIDTVHYILPLGPLGRVIHRFLVADKLREIFDYRERVLRARFGSMPGAPPAEPGSPPAEPGVTIAFIPTPATPGPKSPGPHPPETKSHWEHMHGPLPLSPQDEE